jgi:single-strand DNA-binding protein
MLTATLIGNLGGDPEMRYSASGSPYLRFNVATNGRVKNQSGDWIDATMWVRCTVFGQRADTLHRYLKKGQRVYVEGRLEARPWTDRTGNINAGLEVMADSVEFMSSRQAGPDFDTSDLPETASVADERPQRRMPQTTAVYGPAPRNSGAAVAERDSGDDLEDLPF